MYSEVEKKFKVNYPKKTRATYTSLLNYTSNLKAPIHRWYKYKEGYSEELVTILINKYNKNSKGTILDPFLGSGTTICAANKLGLNAIGFEVNPFSFFLSSVKMANYSKKDIDELKKLYPAILKKSLETNVKYKLPALSISNKVFENKIEKYLMNIKENINLLSINENIKNLLMLGWLSVIEKFSNYKKSGNGLKKKVKIIDYTIDDVYQFLCDEYANIVDDLLNNKIKFKNKIYSTSSIYVDGIIKPSSISGIIYSPPYANCFDYTEIYKLELWFGGFVNEYSDLKNLRKLSVRSHLSAELDNEDEEPLKKSPMLSQLLDKLDSKKLWDKRIPVMLKNYYEDMFKTIANSFKMLESGGFCCIVVGNSAYGGVVFPTDLLLADYAKSIGFKVDCIDVYRYIIPSSQQYELTIKYKKYLRESVICLIKI
ncbi:MAG: DNA methyltransferase [Bacilli bacterium]|nr:DNA methyltransferase [Bacilli bacterium]